MSVVCGGLLHPIGSIDEQGPNARGLGEMVTKI